MGLTIAGGSSGSSVVARGRAKVAGVAQYSQPGVPASSGVTTWTASINRATYFPFLIDTQVVIDQLVIEVTTLGAGNARLAIYSADKDWQPTTLATGSDTGNVDISTTGVKATTLGADLTLAAGRYLFWTNFSVPAALRSIRTGSLLGYAPTLGTTPSFSQTYVTQAFGAPPSTGLVWDTSSAAAPQAQDNPVFVRVKTP